MAETPEVSVLEISNSKSGSFALKQSSWINCRVLAANVAETFQAPAGARYVLFSATGDFWCKIALASTAAAVPAADVTDGTGSELNPAMRMLDGEQCYISIIAGAVTAVSLQFFK